MITAIICAVGGILIGAGVYYLISRISAANIIKKAEEEAEVIKKNKVVEAKEKFIALKLEHDIPFGNKTNASNSRNNV